MSFSSEVKKELLGLNIENKCCEKGFLFGMLQGASDLVLSKNNTRIIVKSYLLPAIQKAMQIIKNNYNVETIIKYGDVDHLNKKRYYCSNNLLKPEIEYDYFNEEKIEYCDVGYTIINNSRGYL